MSIKNTWKIIFIHGGGGSSQVFSFRKIPNEIVYLNIIFHNLPCKKHFFFTTYVFRDNCIVNLMWTLLVLNLHVCHLSLIYKRSKTKYL